MTRHIISYAKVKKAIPGSGGVIARIVKKCGNNNWVSMRDFIAKNPELAEMLRTEEEGVDDKAEGNLIDRIDRGDMEISKWWLARRRRQKYGDSVDISIDKPVVLRVIYDDEKTKP